MEAVGFCIAILDGLVEYIETGHALSDLTFHDTVDHQGAAHINIRALFSHGHNLPTTTALAMLPPCVRCSVPSASILRKLAGFCHGMPVPGGSSLFVSLARPVQLQQWLSLDNGGAILQLGFGATVGDTQVAVLGQPLAWLSGHVQHPSLRLLSLQLAVLSRAIEQADGSMRVDLMHRMIEIELPMCGTCVDPECQLLPLPLSPWVAAAADLLVHLPPPSSTSPMPTTPFLTFVPSFRGVETPPPPLPVTSASPLPLVPPLVLLVEDNRIVQKMTRRFLERAGLAVHVAEHGQQALDMLRGTDDDPGLAATVCVVLMDLQMPVMGGVECTETIRLEEAGWRQRCGDGDGHRRRLPIVALTANALAEERDRCMASGFDGFLTKPVNRATLVAELHLQIGEW
ncbi:CheY-like superfamily [Blastocladiella britannica]|nr:CheY-like superfamily [Blastocladiella britannica]